MWRAVAWLTSNNTTRTVTADLSLANKAAACTFTNTKRSRISLVKNVGGRVVAADQFNVSVSGAGSSTLTNTSGVAIAASAVAITTSGASTGNITNATNPSFFATGGQALVITDAMAAGSTSPLSEYDTRLTCTNAFAGPGATTGLPVNQSLSTYTLTPAAGDDITCTYTNTPKPRITLQKAIAATGGGRVAATDQFILTNGTATGTTTGTGSSVTSSALLFIGTGGTPVTLSESGSGTTNLNNYTGSISCTNSTAGSPTVLPSGTGTLFTFTPANGDVISCTLTNTRKSATLSLRKQWVNATVGDAVTVTATGLTSLSSTADTANETDTGAAQTVYAGATLTFSETAIAGYGRVLSCTGNTNDLSGSNLTISGSDTSITCGYTNTKGSDMAPFFTYMPNTAVVGASYYGKFSCTNIGTAATSAGATCAISSLPSGLSASCSPTVPTASGVAAGASITCTVTGTPTSAGTSSMTITTGATNDTNGGTTTGGNNQASQSITVVNESASGVCTPGATSNLLSTAPFELYEDTNTASTVTTSVGLIANPATYVRTGSNFVVQSDWTFRNGNPAANSPLMSRKLLVNGIEYAEMVTQSGAQEIATLTAKNGAVLDGGLTAMEFYDRSVSGVAWSPANVTLPSSVTSISTVQVAFVANTAGNSDDSGIRIYNLNACALPKITISKISVNGTGAFDFSGNNGFSNQQITTATSGVAVSGAIQTLAAVSMPTTITESSPAIYDLTGVSCTGLGSGTATPNLGAKSVLLDAASMVYGANLACTFTNSRISRNITLTKSWVNGKSGDTVSLNITGGTSATAGSSVAGGATTAATAAAYAGNTVTLSETFTTGLAANYTSTLSCIKDSDASIVTVTGNSFTLPADSNVSCTYTNTRKSATLTLQKAWAVNSIDGDAVTVSSSGFINAASSGLSTASAVGNFTAGTPVTVFAGESGTISETFSSGLAANYTATLACSGNAQPLAGNTLTIDPSDSAIACTYTNSRKSATLTLVKTWSNARVGETATVTSSGFGNNASSGLSTSTGNNTTTGTSVTVYAGESGTISEVLSNAANYNATLACTGNGTALSGNTLTINPADTAITCTQTNTRKSATLTLVKTWQEAKAGDAVNVTATGLSPLVSMADTANETDTGSVQTVYAGDTLTLAETFTTGDAANYTAVLACAGNGTALSGNSLTVNAADTAITCTMTNTRKSATLTLAKTWQNAKIGDGVDVSATGLTTFTASADTANETDTGTAQTVYAGDTLTLAETFTTGDALNYDAALSCSGNATALAGSVLTVNPADTAITCTYTNSRKAVTLTLRKTWVNATVNDAVDITATGLSPLSSVANTASETDTGSVQTVYAGDEITLAETFTTGVSANYSQGLACSGSSGLSGSVLTVGASDTAIVCTFTNTQALRITVRKISQGRVGSFSFTGTNGYPGETLTTVAAGVPVMGTAAPLSAPGVATVLTESLPGGWRLDSAVCLDSNAAATGNNAPVGILSGNQLTIPAGNVVAGADLVCTFINTYVGFTLSGRVFLDNGTGGGTAHDGTQQSGESGLANANIILSDCGGTQYQQVLTNGLGDYTLTIPESLTAGAPLCVSEGANPAYVSVNGAPGTTGGSYSLVPDRTQFTLALSTSYTGVNFGDVPESTLTGIGQQSTAPGTTVEYAHVFTAGTVGSVVFSTAQTPSPANPDWSSRLYRDLNCNGAIDPSEPVITAAVAVTAGQAVCLVQKVNVPVSTGSGNVDISTVSAGFSFTAPSVIVRPYSAADTTTVIDNGLGLVLVKQVRQVSNCPSSGLDTNPFGTSNDALPGNYLEYRIVYTNQSQGTVNDVVVNDATPAFTLYRSASCTMTPPSLLCQVPSSGTGTAPVVGGTGNISWVFTDNPTGLGGGQSGEVRFCVQVEQ